jgi:phosphoribosylanthranilate isomerase
MLKKKVLVNGISNLSDARYCAGMMVDYLSFELNPDHPDYIPIEKILEIKNWLIGAKIGGRISTWPADFDWPAFKPDFLVLETEKLLDQASELVNEVFIESSVSDVKSDSTVKVNFIVTDPDAVTLEGDSIFIVQPDNEELLKYVIDAEQISGISLRSSREVRPGFSEYGELMEILEMLED